MDELTENSMLLIFRFNMFASFATIIPWVGAVSDQLFLRNMLPKFFGQLFIFLGVIGVLIMGLIFKNIYFDSASPLRQILPIVFTMTFSSILSVLLALAIYIFL